MVQTRGGRGRGRGGGSVGRARGRGDGGAAVSRGRGGAPRGGRTAGIGEQRASQERPGMATRGSGSHSAPEIVEEEAIPSSGGIPEVPINLFFNEDAEAHYNDFGSRNLCETKVFDKSSIQDMKFNSVFKYFKPHFLDTLLTLEHPAYHEETVQFYANLGQDKTNKDVLTTKVYGRELVVSKFSINAVLGCPYVSSEAIKPVSEGGPYEFFFQQQLPNQSSTNPIDCARMGRVYFKRRSRFAGSAKEYKVTSLNVEHRVIFDLVCENCYPSGGHNSEPTTHHLMLFYYIMEGLKINPGYTILAYMMRAAGYKASRMPYGGLITALILQAGIQPVGRPFPLEYYDDSWLIHKGWEINNEGKFGPREPISSKKAKKLLPGEEKKWKKHILRCFGFLEKEVEMAKTEIAETSNELQRVVSNLGLEMELSDEETMPSFDFESFEEPKEGDEDDEPIFEDPDESDSDDDDEDSGDDEDGGEGGNNVEGSDQEDALEDVDTDEDSESGSDDGGGNEDEMEIDQNLSANLDELLGNIPPTNDNVVEYTSDLDEADAQDLRAAGYILTPRNRGD